MSTAQLVITAVVLEGRSKSDVARDYDVSRQWVQQLCKRYDTEGDAAFLPHSRLPHHSPHAVALDVEDRIVRLRKTLTKRGLDAGADTIASHLATDPTITNVPAISTIWRILQRRGFITPQPHKRPRSSWKGFAATTQPMLASRHHPLAPRSRRRCGNPQHHRRPLPPRHRQRGPPHHQRPRRHRDLHHRLHQVGHTRLGAHRQRRHLHRRPPPRRTHLPRNHPRRTRRALLNSRPYHPQTCGKVERFHQTQKRWLTAHPATTLAQLQQQLDEFTNYYNTERPHRAINRTTPQQAFSACLKATPSGYLIPAHCRIRTDVIDAAGVITLRHNSRLHHIGLGKRRTGTKVTVLIDDLDIRVLDRSTGHLIRKLTLDPQRDYQPRGVKCGYSPENRDEV